jgi:hypothetical protein
VVGVGAIRAGTFVRALEEKVSEDSASALLSLGPISTSLRLHDSEVVTLYAVRTPSHLRPHIYHSNPRLTLHPAG